jgi:hypothetical protein
MRQFDVVANRSAVNNSSGIRTGYDTCTFTPLLLARKILVKLIYNLLLMEILKQTIIFRTLKLLKKLIEK